MHIEEDIKLDYSDVLLKPQKNGLYSRKQVILEREFTFYHSPKKWKGIPIMTSNMASCGTFEMAKYLAPQKIITTFHKYYTTKDYKEFFKTFKNPDYIAYTLGLREKDISQLEEMIKTNLMDNFSFICLDVPNGYIEKFQELVRKVRKLCPKHIIIAGNVVCSQLTAELITAGADIVKIGIGPGSVCTTRKMTGVGYPQFSAIVKCARQAHKIKNTQGNGLIIADGGLNYPSCMAKAYGAGSDFTMSGSMFSGFDQSGGNLVEKNGKKFKEYFGSSSNKAMKEFYGNKGNYRASEGRYTLIPYKGDLTESLQDLLGSLRSTGTYIGAKKIEEFQEKAVFIRVNNQINKIYEKYEKDD